MEGKKLFRSIQLRNLLSYGLDTTELVLEPLNVFIGPNASGKSNLIEALSILAAAPGDLQVPIREGGGISDWIWKGSSRASSATIDVEAYYPAQSLRYRLSFGQATGRFLLIDEIVEGKLSREDDSAPFTYYAYNQGNAKIHVDESLFRYSSNRALEDVLPNQSILSQRRDPIFYPELTYLAEHFGSIAFFRDWDLGRHAALRLPQRTDLPEFFLLEGAGNLGLVLNSLQNRPDVKRTLLSHLKKFYDRVADVTTKIQGGTVQIFFHEEGLRDPVPATRVSDGTLRFLCLLTILCHPEPPAVVCIEEPELGLHPDVIPIVAELLIDASARTQLFVTTHSDALVDAMSEHPESVVVCERGEGGTELRRLQADQLKEWLERYRLGELWQMGELGGNP